MSAFCGFLNLDSAPADPALVAAQLARLKHRGPDGAGTFTDGPVALGHALLSITPESVMETSPWRSVDGQRAIAFDGRLDHRDDLCAALGVPTMERAVPDPELILRAYEKWGTECAAKLEGEFAFALWDARQRQLLCASDTMGARNLYHHFDGRRFIFASQIRGVLAVPGVPWALDELTLACQLGGAQHPPAGRTLYAGILRLPPAHTLTVRPGGEPRISQYWRLVMEPEVRLHRPEEYAEALRELLNRATRSALRTRHPVGAMLSGGLDSTGVACLAARELAARGQRLTTVSGILPDDFKGDEWARDERLFVRSVLDQHPNMDAQWARGLAFPVVEFSDADYELHDEPDPDPKSFRTRELVQLAQQQGVRVLLGGMGGDMAASYKGTGFLEQLARRGHWLNLCQQVQLQARTRGMTVSGIFRREVLRPVVPRWLRQWNDELRHGVHGEGDVHPIHPDFAARIGSEELGRARKLANDPPQDSRKFLLTLVNAGWLGEVSSWMARHLHTMESPQPLMDRRIWDWCFRVPVGVFVHGGMPRSLYRRALHDVVPAKVLQRTSKGWFAPDYQQRLAACTPTLKAFLAQHPVNDPVWTYVHRPKVEDALRLLTQPGSGDRWDNRHQLILCRGLRLAHFVAWFGRGATS